MFYATVTVDYAHNFKEYLDKYLKKTHQDIIGVDAVTINRQALLDWLKKNLSDLKDSVNRKRNKIIDEIIRPIFESDQRSWGMMPFLGKASSPYLHPQNLTCFVPNSQFSFEKLERIAPSNTKDIVQELRNLFPP